MAGRARGDAHTAAGTANRGARRGWRAGRLRGAAAWWVQPASSIIQPGEGQQGQQGREGAHASGQALVGRLGDLEGTTDWVAGLLARWPGRRCGSDGVGACAGVWAGAGVNNQIP